MEPQKKTQVAFQKIGERDTLAAVLWHDEMQGYFFTRS